MITCHNILLITALRVGIKYILELVQCLINILKPKQNNWNFVDIMLKWKQSAYICLNVNVRLLEIMQYFNKEFYL